MKKIISIISATTILSVFGITFLAFAGTALAVKPNGHSAVNGLAHPGQVSQLYLYEKDASWNAVVGGAWGKMTFGSDFVFNGHGLQPTTDYTLIRYKDPWPGSPVCLAAGKSNAGGNINLSGIMLDGGPKVWLVLSSDVNCGTGMTGWNPTSYLFEYNTI